jgi:hypothetical protein
MKRCFGIVSATALLLFVGPSLGRVFAQGSAPEISFDSVPNFLKLPPDMYLGEVSGVAVNSKGHVFVFQRGNTNGLAYAAAVARPKMKFTWANY